MIERLLGPPFSRRRMCCGLGCVAPLAMLLALGVLLLRPPPSPPPTSPAEQAQAAARLDRIASEMAAVEEDARARRPHPFTLRVTEKEINAFLATDEETRKLLRAKEIERAFARVDDGCIWTTVVRRIEGVPVAGTAAIAPVVRKDRTLGFRIESLRIGQVGLPSPLTRRTARQIVRALEERAASHAAAYRSVSLRRGSVVLTGDTPAGMGKPAETLAQTGRQSDRSR